MISLKLLFILITTSYHAIATGIEHFKYQPPGQLIDLGGYKIHLYAIGSGEPTVVIEHSLGGIDGYFLLEEIANLTKVCIYDRPGYGWSQMSPLPRCSSEMAKELDLLLTKAGIEPPYILVGNSLGSYNVRLYAHYFPEKVMGVVLTDGLHEQEMLNLSSGLMALKLFFMSGFAMSILGSILGIIRFLGIIRIFELIKKELRQFPLPTLSIVKRSFYRPQHWLTMWREMWNLETSARQVSQAHNLGDIPLVSIKASTFLNFGVGNFSTRIKSADNLREKMHEQLLKLSNNSQQIIAKKSSHFVWIDEPEIIKQAIQEIINQVK